MPIIIPFPPVPPGLALPEDQFPYNESRAIEKKLRGIKVDALTYEVGGREVPVKFVGPEMQSYNGANYPGIYLTYGEVSRAPEREHRGPVLLPYAPPGYSRDVQVPKDIENKNSVATESWEENMDPAASPYRLPETPIPYWVGFDIAVLTRNYSQNFQMISQLQKIDRIPERFGFLEVPEDGTVRTLELTGGPDTSVIADEDGKRLVQTLYSVRVAAELSLYDLEVVKRVSTINTDFPQYL